MSLRYEPMSTTRWADPSPIYRRLRETAPIYRSPETHTYCLSRHEDVKLALGQAQLLSSHGMEKALIDCGQRPGLRDLLALGRFVLRARINPLKSHRPPNLVAEDQLLFRQTTEEAKLPSGTIPAGASLARLEGKVATEALVPELSENRDPKPLPELIDSFVVRGPRSLELHSTL